MTRKLAKIISSIFEPFTVSFVALLIVINSLQISQEEKLFWFTTFIALVGLPPLFVLIYEKKIGKIKDWFMTNRVERRDVQFAWFFGSLLFLSSAISLSAPKLLIALSLTMLILSLLIAVVTIFWKISVHMVGVSLLVLTPLLVISSSFLVLTLLLPLVGWARWKLGAHTLTQLTIGALTTITIIYLTFFFLGLVSI